MSPSHPRLQAFASIIFCVALLASAALAQTPPNDAPAQTQSAGDALFARLLTAQTRAQAQSVEQEIWTHWYTGPTDEATAALRAAMRLIVARSYGAAEDRLGELIAAHPEWAEPYNQRAIMYFFMGAYDASLADIDRVLRREPRHFGALGGAAQIHGIEGRAEAAQRALERAWEVHPWLGGRTPPETERSQEL